MKVNKHTVITAGIVVGLVVGFVVGELVFRYAGERRLWYADVFRFIGTAFFMNLLRMVLIPLVVSSVVVGVASIGDPGSLGKVGGAAVLYYFATMLAAVVLGLVLVTTIQPGEGMNAEVIAQGEAAYAQVSDAKRAMIGERGEGGLWGAFKNITGQLIPSNPIGAAADGQVLPVITFSVLVGVVLTMVGEKGRALLGFFESLLAVVMMLVEGIIWLAPVGVMFLVAYTVAGIGSAELIGPLLKYMATVLGALAVHGLVVLPLVLWLVGRANPYRYMHQMREALMTAFGTDSSSATLPVTMKCAEELGGVTKRASGFVLPLGATINMDGTALYEAVAVVFLFQCYGIELGVTELGIVAVTATLAAVGAAGIPSAGLVTMVIVVQAVNGSLGDAVSPLPLAAVGIILGVDRIVDMCRTTVNVWGDAVGAKIITRIAPDPE